MILQGDCLKVMPTLDANSVDAIVTDPPYELSNDGKTSADRIAAELMFPQQPNLRADIGGECHLVGLISQIARLRGVRTIPCPSAAVPVSSVAFNNDIPHGNIQIKDSGEAPEVVSYSDGTGRENAEHPEHIGDFFLELGDSESGLNAANRVGCGFVAGGLGIGFGVLASSLPSLLTGHAAVVLGDQKIRALHDTLASLVGTFSTAEDEAVARLDLRGGSENALSTSAALKFLFVGLISGAKLVRTRARTSGLPAVVQSYKVSVVDGVTNRALSFNLLFHKQIITSKGFMGKDWDGSKIAFNVDVWREALRVLKPGGHLLAFGGSRTYHRLACAIEDAGFEVRDQIMWLYGSGFPKSLDVSKAIDKAAGQVGGIGDYRSADHAVKRKPGNERQHEGYKRPWRDNPEAEQRSLRVYIPATDAAKQWQGWGSALKPAHESICVARKPLSEGTIAANVLTWGVGALNIDGCRIAGTVQAAAGTHGFGSRDDGYMPGTGRQYQNAGRWPSNLIHDGSPEVLAGFPVTTSGALKPYSEKHINRSSFGFDREKTYKKDKDTGSAARFFYCAKASKKDRDEGLDGFDVAAAGVRAGGRKEGSAGLVMDGGKANPFAGTSTQARNTHPTVKPTDLMRYLVRLVTPAGGLVLDPFAGSGSTGKAAVLEGFRFVGIELQPEYAEIARARIAAAGNPAEPKAKPKKPRARPKKQPDLFA